MSVKQIQISEPRRARPPPPELRFARGASTKARSAPSLTHRAISRPTAVAYKRHLVQKSAYHIS